MMPRLVFRPFSAGLLLASLLIVPQAQAQLEKSDSKVKATATASKADADGKQTVTITLEITKGWHLYANPVNHNNETLDPNKTTVKIAAKDKLKFEVQYPSGTTKVDKDDKYNIYEGTVKIQASVTRSPGDSSPLQISVGVNACSKSVCLQQATITLTAK
jgi:DsbC/DsbD-like thiol-disulfide interchange protein